MLQKSLHAKPPSIYTMTLCALFTALITVGAFVQIQFPVVPITLQTLFVILCALLLGARRSAVSVGLYLFLGLAGLPVFTKGGGPGYVLQPTFGYLLGFLVAAVAVGFLSRKVDPADGATRITVDLLSRRADPLSRRAGLLFPRSRTGVFLCYWGIGLLGILIIYLIGMVYMYFLMNYYMQTPVGFLGFFTVNLLMTFAGDVFKCFVAAWLTVRLLPILRRSTRWSE